MQDADRPEGAAVHQQRGLVCHHRSDGCLLSDSDLGQALAVPQVRFRRQAVQIPGSAVRNFPGSSHLYQVNGGGFVASATEGNTDCELSRRLAPLCTLAGSVSGSFGFPPGARRAPRSAAQFEEEQTGAFTADAVPGPSDRFSGCAPVTDAAQAVVPQGLPLPFQAGGRSHMETVSPSFGSDGVLSAGRSTGPPAHAAGTKVPTGAGVGPQESPRYQGTCHETIADGPPLVGRRRESCQRECARAGNASFFSPDGCFIDRLGRSVQRKWRQWSLEWSSSHPAHQHVGTDSGPSWSSPFSATPSGPARAGYDRQCDGSRICQQARRVGFSTPLRAGSSLMALGVPKVSFTEGSPCAGGAELCSGSVVQGGTGPRQMETPPSGGSRDLAPLRTGRGRPVCVTGEHPLPTFLLPGEGRSSPWSGRPCSPLATGPDVRLSPICPPSASPEEGAHGGSEADPGGSTLAAHDLVLGHPPSTGRDSMGASNSSGLAVSSTGDSGSSLSPRAQALGMAPEGPELLAMGLSPSVVSTLQEARAPSTRALYAHRWRAFVAWCRVHQTDPLTCSAPAVLRFLQGLLDAGRAPSTLRGMVAAIKAARVGRYQLPEGVDKLISRLLKGARRHSGLRGRPPLPPWDLELVLQALEYPPFEPLESVDLKWLSVKSALLLALAMAKRVGELHALSVHEDLCRFLPEGGGVVLRPNPAFLPKVLSASQPGQEVVLWSLYSAPTQEGERGYSLVCPVRALRVYLHRTRVHRQTDQLFVCFRQDLLGQALSKARLSHWIVEAIQQAYVGTGAPFPSGVRAHSTRGMATSWASVNEI
ncbi:uncharacterized protein LOC126391201 [Epinephelus moara]|uniref:uncharacterized protein LOC126391201 n=1 Tax=Epinephelus moara TaxID=300413 RepID=UPI00214E938B|nr:uncharacterized protein LOC126391201 [Epinephelus moara]